MSTYSTNLALTLIGTGEEAGTWGTTTNTNLGTLLEQAISGYVTQAVTAGADTTITIPNGSTGVARNMYIELTGTGGSNTNLIVPANKKLYFIYNNTSSGQVTVKVSGQTGVSVPNGSKYLLVSNGTDIVQAITTNALNTSSFTISQTGDNLNFISTVTCTGSISGTTLTATVVTVGYLIYGQTLSGTGVTGGTTLGAQQTSTETAAATLAYSSGGASGASSVILASVTGVALGQMISGTGVPAGTYVGDINTGTNSVSLVDRTGAAVTFTTQASGNYTFAAANGKGTYTVSASQTVSSTTISLTKTIASLSVAGVFTANTSLNATGIR